MFSRTKLPFVVVMVALAVATLSAAVTQLSEDIPVSPWEPAIAMEAVRLNAGLPVYEAAHATHMYGPLLNVFYAGVFRVFGLNLLAARLAMSICGIALVVFLSAIVGRGRSAGTYALACILFLALNFRTNLVLLSMQPDALAALLGVSAIYLWATASRSSPLRGVGAIAFFVGAMLVKQTGAAFALIPLGHALLWHRPITLSATARAMVPFFSVLIALAAVRFFAPAMFAAVVTVPSSIKVYPARALTIAGYVLTTFPVWVLTLWATWRGNSSLEDRERWFISALVVLAPTGVWTMAKSGGDYNSLLFLYLALTALFVSRFDSIQARLAAMPVWRGLAVASTVASLTLFSYFCQVGKAASLLMVRQGDEKYSSAVTVARRLGHVVTPQDPTIAYRANGHFGRSLFLELDTHSVNGNWPNELPGSISEELEQSRNVVTVRGYVPAPVFERGLVTRGFHVQPVPELANSAYTLWVKDGR